MQIWKHHGYASIFDWFSYCYNVRLNRHNYGSYWSYKLFKIIAILSNLWLTVNAFVRHDIEYVAYNQLDQDAALIEYFIGTQ